MNLFAYFACRWYGHPGWERKPGLDVLYACGEDGAWAWCCTRCGAKVLLDSRSKPDAFSQETLEALIKAARVDTGIRIGGAR